MRPGGITSLSRRPGSIGMSDGGVNSGGGRTSEGASEGGALRATRMSFVFGGGQILRPTDPTLDEGVKTLHYLCTPSAHGVLQDALEDRVAHSHEGKKRKQDIQHFQ